MAKSRYIGIRFLQTLITLWIVLTFLFFLFRLMPGSYSDIMLARGASPASVEAFKAKWGLDDPIIVQYFRYVINLFRLDFGTSLQANLPVTKFVGERILNTAILVIPGVSVGYILAIYLGALMGFNPKSWYDKYGTFPFIVVGMMPEFFTSILVIVIFASWLGLFPSGDMLDSSVIGTFSKWWMPYTTRSFLYHYILPFSVVVVRFMMQPLLTMRTNVVETQNQDFIKYHKITGLSKGKRIQHIRKHSILPVITLYPVSLVKAISGLVLIETVFNWPGIGATLVQAVLSHDYPVVQFVFLIAAAFVIIMNFVVDIVYSMIDPRIQIGSESA